MRRRPISELGVTLGLAAIGAIWLVPYAWMLVTSLKTLPEIVAAPAAPLPSGLNFGAYSEVFRSMPVGRYFWNTTVMSLAIAAGFSLGGSESYPGVFGDFGGFADDARVENGTIALSDRPGIGFEGQGALYRIMRALAGV